MLALRDESLLSGRLEPYLRWAAWSVVGAFLACLYLVYIAFSTLQRGSSVLVQPSVRFLLGGIGGAGVIGGMILSKAMWAYWKRDVTYGKALKTLWFLLMTLVPLFGCCVYYFAAYAPQRTPKHEPS
jgi:hypothetical protein